MKDSSSAIKINKLRAEEEPVVSKQAAWYDRNDEDLEVDLNKVARLRKLKKSENENVIKATEYNERLKEQFEKMNGGSEFYKWAYEDKKVEEEESEIQKLLKTDKKFVEKYRGELPSSILEINKLKNANYEEPNKAVVQSVEFHPRDNIVLTAGLDRTLRLFKVDSTENVKISSVHLKDLPIYSAHFALEGKEILASGNKKHFYYYDIEKQKIQKVSHVFGRDDTSLRYMSVSPGLQDQFAFSTKDGSILVMCSRTKKLLYDLKTNAGGVNSLAFSNDGRSLFSASEDGYVYHWDLLMRKCLDSFPDEGSFKTISLALSPDNKYLSTGTNTGVVNIYSLNNGSISNKKPVKTLMSLTTSITGLEFNKQSEILAYYSKWKKNAVKFLHLPSMTVFSNFPTFKHKLRSITALNFSADGDYMCMGNDEGSALLYRLKHYSPI